MWQSHRNPDTVRAPELAVIAHKNLPEYDPAEAYWPGAPDLAVEVFSPDDTPREVSEKTEAWLNAGVKLLWIVNPKLRTVAVKSSESEVLVNSGHEEVVEGEVVPGFCCTVAEIFAPLA